MKLDRTSIMVVVVQTGALNVNDTDDNKVFSKDDMGLEDSDPGRTMCLFPFELLLEYDPMDEVKKIGNNL